MEVTQGLLVDPSLRLLGRAGHTLAGNVLFGLGYLLLGLARKPYQLMVTLVSAKQALPTPCESVSAGPVRGQGLFMPVKPDSAVEAACVAEAVRAGVGEGKVYADLEACTAVAKTIGPLLFSGALAFGRRSGRPWLWGALALVSHALAQLCASKALAPAKGGAKE